ncbi:MAG TPA: hypothetical protein VKS82_18140 [Streptosporangiaceae bacterium]|nr:hypothetical protein [Streptosporangiaceae bacterium]
MSSPLPAPGICRTFCAGLPAEPAGGSSHPTTTMILNLALNL